MTLRDVYQNWNDLKPQKKRQALQAILNHIDYIDGDHDLLMYYIIQLVVEDWEDNDYFGTEGLSV